jgi:GTPase SAR1 family protein
MGLQNSRDSELVNEQKLADAGKSHSKAIDRRTRIDLEAARKVNKLLLLGAGESGKSTLLRQLNEIHGKGFTDTEREVYRPIIFNNMITAMKSLINAAPEFGGPVSCTAALEYVRGLAGDAAINRLNVAHFKALWKDPGIQQAYDNQSKFQLLDCTKHFLDQVDVVAQEGFIPTEDDVRRCRVRTTGIVETKFEVDGHQFLLVDVGGQRAERRKWIHCFENVTTLLFVGVLAEYDLLCFEDNKTNRMMETLQLWEQMCETHWFRESNFILFLNKRDLFDAKIDKVLLRTCPAFKDYTGPNNFSAGCQLIQGAFEKTFRLHNPNKQLYVHMTCATHTGNVAAVFEAVKQVVLQLE